MVHDREMASSTKLSLLELSNQDGTVDNREVLEQIGTREQLKADYDHHFGGWRVDPAGRYYSCTLFRDRKRPTSNDSCHLFSKPSSVHALKNACLSPR